MERRRKIIWYTRIREKHWERVSYTPTQMKVRLGASHTPPSNRRWLKETIPPPPCRGKPAQQIQAGLEGDPSGHLLTKASRASVSPFPERNQGRWVGGGTSKQDFMTKRNGLRKVLHP